MNKQRREQNFSTQKDNSSSQHRQRYSAFCINNQCSDGNQNCNLWAECPMFKGSLDISLEKPRSKYGAEKIEIAGVTFDSKKEARRWYELKILEEAGEIKNLRRQVKFELIPAQCEPDIIGKRGGVKKGRTIEQAVNYIADFVYEDQNGKTVVEDTKGVKTDTYIIKRKLLLYFYGIKINEL